MDFKSGMRTVARQRAGLAKAGKVKESLRETTKLLVEAFLDWEKTDICRVVIWTTVYRIG